MRGFTLIELSIVLVIIGLIVGGVLVGRELIASATVRAQVTQIERYNTAANTFRGKYGYLPGDIPSPYATQFGFIAPGAGAAAGEGDGNGVLQGAGGNNECCAQNQGETPVFWVDLSTAKLIDGAFNAATNTSHPAYNITLTSTPYSLNSFFPQAKIGNGNYVYVWSGGVPEVNGEVAGDNVNYFGISVPNSSEGGIGTGGWPYTDQGMTVQQAYGIDKKMDDGLPQSGNVQAWYVDWEKTPAWVAWSTASGSMGDYDQTTGGPITAQTSNPYYDLQNGGVISQECYTNGNTLNPEQYNLAYGSNVNCGLSFRFQ